MSHRSSFRAALIAAVLAAPSALAAQAWNYPAFQQPLVVDREFNFLLADGGRPSGTSLVFQWREGRARGSQLSLDAGFANTSGAGADDTFLLIGGQYARLLAAQRPDLPFNVLFTAGANAALGDPTHILRFPVGISAGHLFRIDPRMTLTPFVHPRLAIDYCTQCQIDGSGDLQLGLVLDLGASLQFAPGMALRLAATISALSDENLLDGDAFGVSFAYTPGYVRR